ncbi:MAG: HEAT repeat domain-containing protein [Myxococcota bacterium]|nr:HEAT repeat domain-containing protein [Myxococcota bacterium]
MRDRYRDLFAALLDPDPHRADKAYDAVLFDRGEALPDLEELYETAEDARLRFYAVQLMGFSEDPRASALVVEALDDKEPTVRAEACRALEDLRARDACDALTARIEDLDVHVRRAAREAMSALGCRKRRR